MLHVDLTEISSVKALEAKQKSVASAKQDHDGKSALKKKEMEMRFKSMTIYTTLLSSSALAFGPSRLASPRYKTLDHNTTLIRRRNNISSEPPFVYECCRRERKKQEWNTRINIYQSQTHLHLAGALCYGTLTKLGYLFSALLLTFPVHVNPIPSCHAICLGKSKTLLNLDKQRKEIRGMIVAIK